MTIAIRRAALFRHIRTLAVALATATVFSATPADAEKRLALVIGNNTYDEVEPLDRAVADARAYRKVLEEQRGFQVFYAENAGRREMNARVGEFLSSIRPGDTAMIVYSGHGVQLDSERRDSLYLLPTDFPNRDPGRGAERLFFDAESLNFARLAEDVAARGAKLRIYVLDACRNNPFSRKEGTRAIGVSRGIGRITSSSGEFVIYAAAPGEVAFDSLPGDPTNSENSLFTRAFIKHFRSGTYLEDVANDVQAEVVKLARAANVEQEPYYSDGVAGRTCLEENCGLVISTDAKLAAEQEELYWKYCEENSEPLYCRAFLDQYPESWRAGLAQARLKVLADQPPEAPDDNRLAAVGDADKTAGSVVRGGDAGGKPADAADGGLAPDTGTSTGDSGSSTGGGTDVSGDAGGDTSNDATAGTAPPPKTGAAGRKENVTDSGATVAGEAGPATGGTGDTGSTDGAAAAGGPKTGTENGTTEASEDFKVAALDPEQVARSASAEPIDTNRDQLRDIQVRLTVLGHKPGPIDGLMGNRTRRAIVAFQEAEKMTGDGNVSEALIAMLSLRVPDEALKDYYAAIAEEERRAKERRDRRARERAINRSNTPRTTTTTRAPTTTTTTRNSATTGTTTTRKSGTGDRTVTVAPGVKVRTNIRLRDRNTNDKPFYCKADPSRQWWDDDCK